jgi:hypothetical protein
VQVGASADRFEAAGDEFLDPPEVVLVGGLDVQRQRVLRGVHRPLAPAQADGPDGVGPFDVPHLGRHVAVVSARLVTQVLADFVGVLAELDEIPAWVLGLDDCFGSEQGSPFWAFR